MTYKPKKKKEITPAGNGTQLASYTPLGIPFFVPFRDATQSKENSEGAVAKSASGDSPFTHGRLDRNQRRNLSLLAGGDCADWMRKRTNQTAERKRNVKPKGDHADHRTPAGSSSQR